MCTLRDVVIFLAGAEFLHTISHILLPYFIPLPLNMGFMILTPGLNMVINVINVVVTIALLWWAKKLSRK